MLAISRPRNLAYLRLIPPHNVFRILCFTFDSRFIKYLVEHLHSLCLERFYFVFDLSSLKFFCLIDILLTVVPSHRRRDNSAFGACAPLHQYSLFLRFDLSGLQWTIQDMLSSKQLSYFPWLVISPLHFMGIFLSIAISLELRIKLNGRVDNIKFVSDFPFWGEQ